MSYALTQKVLPLIPFTEHWTTIYAPMNPKDERSNGKNDRFFEIESIANIANLAKSLKTCKSPFVAMETSIGGDITSRSIVPEYNIYFFVEGDQRLVTNGGTDTEAKSEALYHATAFVNYIAEMQTRYEDEGNPLLGGIDVDNIHFETFGPIMNRWFCVGLAIRDLNARSRCIVESDYISDL